MNEARTAADVKHCPPAKAPKRKPHPMGRYRKRKATSLDHVIGANIEAWRKRRRLTLEDLGNAIDRTQEQVRKYENATNRVSAGLLFRIAHALDVSVQALFEGCDELLEDDGDAS